jgi:dihydrofolate synthase/folylpolyglutamate synthase
VVAGVPIAVRDFADLVEEVIGHADKVASRLGAPTEFELLTAAAFTWFRRQAVDTAVVEVGMGGRLDATNVWQGGVSAITNVALDHTQHLGPTIVHIAREKAPIVKRGDSAVVTGAEGAALAVITRRARRLAVPIRVVEAPPVTAFDRSGLRLEVADGRAMRVGLLGRHQAANAAIALAVLDELAAAGIAQVRSDDVERAFAGVRWPGRLELLSLAADGTAHAAPREGPQRSQPDVLLDGAHNAHGARALAAALDELRPLLSAGRPTLLMGALLDKDVSGMVAPLAACPALHDARVVATSVPDAPRSLPATELAALWKSAVRDAAHHAAYGPGTSIQAVEEPANALSQAMDYSRQADGPLIVCGSLYLVGFVRGRLVAHTLA